MMRVQICGEIYECDDQGWVKCDGRVPAVPVSMAVIIALLRDSGQAIIISPDSLNSEQYSHWRLEDWEDYLFEGKGNTTAKQPRYTDNTGDDWIDDCARTMTPEEFRGAMKFTMGKYMRRLGKKDEVVKEVEKIADYAQRWLEYERQSANG